MPNDIDWPKIGMTLEEAARALRVNTRTVSEAIRDDGLPARKVGVQWRISPKALEEWLAGNGAARPARGEDEAVKGGTEEI